jgi:hypothetical protein
MKFRFKPSFSPVLFFVGIVVVLTTFQLNQSSVGMYEAEGSRQTLLGEDRPIRSDEWYVRLPWLASQTDRDFPTNSATSGSHDAGITYDLPAKSLDLLVRPHLIPYFVFGFDRAVSAEWWSLVFGSAMAVYLFLTKIGIRKSIAFPASLLVGCSPGLHWWTVNSSFSIILYGCLGAGLLLHAIEKSRFSVKVFYSVLSGWMFSCAALVLYPPFQVPTLVLIGVVLLIQVTSQESPISRKERFVGVLISIGVFMAFCAWFVAKHRTGLQLMANTVYPGERRSASGGVNIASLLGTTFDLKSSSINSGSVNFTNQSENASSFMIFLPIVFSLPTAIFVAAAKTRLGQFRATCVWFVVLMSWMLLPLPIVLGDISLLNRVPPDRIKPVLIFVMVVGLALYLESVHEHLNKKRLLTGFLLFSFLTIWAGGLYVVNDSPIGLSQVWALAFMWLLPTAVLLFVNQRFGLWLLVIVSVFTAGQINPIHSSLDPLRKNKLSNAIEQIDPNNEMVWMTFSGTPQVRGVLTSSGSPVVTSVSPYPDFQFWKQFDPSSKYKSAWNRYGHVLMVSRPGEVRISSTQSDVIVVELDPCAANSPIKSGTLFVESDMKLVPCAISLKDVIYQDSTWHIMQKR